MQIKNIQTAVKTQQIPAFSEVTPRQNKKILLFGDKNKKYLFPLLKDKDVGIQTSFQSNIIETVVIFLVSITTTIEELHQLSSKKE
jgi:hypothetical protein